MIRKAFTIIELIVVIGIMVVLLAIALPAIKSLTRNNNQKQAINLATVMIANAHSLALQSHTPAGLVIYEDPALSNQTSLQLVVQSSQSELRYFVAAPQSNPQALPTGIKVAALDDSAISMRTEFSTTATKCRIILFDGTGQMILVDAIAKDSSMTSAASAAWNLNATTGGGHSSGVSTPALVVYSGSDLKAATDNGVVVDNATRANWIQKNADILVVNAYIGNILR